MYAAGGGAGSTGVEAAVVADLDLHAAVPDRREDLRALPHRAGHRFLAEDGHPGPHRGQEQFGVGVGRRGDHHAVHARRQDGLRRVRDLGAEPFRGPLGGLRERVGDH
jgi:hypothetical protein